MFTGNPSQGATELRTVKGISRAKAPSASDVFVNHTTDHSGVGLGVVNFLAIISLYVVNFCVSEHARLNLTMMVSAALPNTSKSRRTI